MLIVGGRATPKIPVNDVPGKSWQVAVCLVFIGLCVVTTEYSVYGCQSVRCEVKMLQDICSNLAHFSVFNTSC